MRFASVVGAVCVGLLGCSVDAGSTEGGSGNGNQTGGTPTSQTPSNPTNPQKPAAEAFVVSGHVDAMKTASLHTLDATGNTSAKHVTHVMGVTPSSQNTQRVVSEVAADGSFSLNLDPARLWVLVFVDSSRVGSDMIVGVFRARGLDTLAPLVAGRIDLGDVATSAGVASTSVSYDSLLAAMGLDPASALFVSAIDDMCLRVVNPDMDGDGKIDALEEGHQYSLDFHVHFGMQTDHDVVVSDLFGNFLPDTTTIGYGGTGIYASSPSRVLDPNWSTSYWASFDDDVHYAANGYGTTTTVSPPNAVPRADMIQNGYGDYASVGLLAVRGFEMPQGEYRFGFGPSTLTFTDVRTRTDAQLQAAESFIMPFVRFAFRDETCTTHCGVDHIDWEWRKRTDAGWVVATETEIALVAADQGGFLSIQLDNDPAKSAGWSIGKTVRGQIPWSTLATNDAAIVTAVKNATTDDLCHIGLSYDDKLGMRYFGSIGDAPHTCGQP